MLLEVIVATAGTAYQTISRAALHNGLLADGHPAVERASLGIPDTLFIFVVALVVFGPKRLPEIGRQLGKLMFEFRRASNDFKMQIEEELRLSDQQERQKKLEMQAAAATAAAPLAIADSETAATPAEAIAPESADTTSVTEEKGLIIQPPSSGTIFGARAPNHAALEAADENTKTSEAPIDKGSSMAQSESTHVEAVEEAGVEKNGASSSSESATAHHG